MTSWPHRYRVFPTRGEENAIKEVLAQSCGKEDVKLMRSVRADKKVLQQQPQGFALLVRVHHVMCALDARHGFEPYHRQKLGM